MHKKLKDVLRLSYELQYSEKLEIDSEKYNNFKKQVLVAERLVLQTIAFDLTVEHPYRFLNEQLGLLKLLPEERKIMMQTAWSFVNDSFASTVCLQFRPQLIAAAAIYLASKNNKVELKSEGDKEWWQVANINAEDLEDSCSQILEALSPTETLPATSSSNSNSTAASSSPKPPVASSAPHSSSPRPPSSHASPAPGMANQDLPASHGLKRSHPDLPDPR